MYSSGWSSVRTALRFSFGLSGIPFGIAHDASTPSCSRRRSQWRRRAWCSWTTNRPAAPLALPSLRRAPFGSVVRRKSRLVLYVFRRSAIAVRTVPARLHPALRHVSYAHVGDVRPTTTSRRRAPRDRLPHRRRLRRILVLEEADGRPEPAEAVRVRGRRRKPAQARAAAQAARLAGQALRPRQEQGQGRPDHLPLHALPRRLPADHR